MTDRLEDIRRNLAEQPFEAVTDDDVAFLLAELDAAEARLAAVDVGAVQAAGLRAEKAEARIRELAVMFDVPDGGQYLNDWKERAKNLARLAACEQERAEARAAMRAGFKTADATILRLHAKLARAEEALRQIEKHDGHAATDHCVPAMVGTARAYFAGQSE